MARAPERAQRCGRSDIPHRRSSPRFRETAVTASWDTLLTRRARQEGRAQLDVMAIEEREQVTQVVRPVAIAPQVEVAAPGGAERGRAEQVPRRVGRREGG